MVAVAVQNIKFTFFLTWKPLNMLRGTLFDVSLLLNTLYVLFFAV